MRSAPAKQRAERDATIHRLDAQLCETDRRLRVERKWSFKRPVRWIKRLLTALARGHLTPDR
jgi:hypothetical protein